MIEREEYLRIGRPKEAAHMLGYSDLLSRPSIEMKTTWELIMKKITLKQMQYEVRLKKFHWSFHHFLNCINPKLNVIVRVDFELAYYHFAVLHINHYATETHDDSVCYLIDDKI